MTLILKLCDEEVKKSDPQKDLYAVDMIVSNWWLDHKIEQFAKAMKPEPNPDHQYSHRGGSEEHPKFYYTDSNGNQIQYTNAPKGHSEYCKYAGDPMPHPCEPTSDMNPEYYSNDGRKLSRAPVKGAPVEWNQSYHNSDNKNLWAGRWVNPETGDHEYTYLDADLRNNDFLRVHHQNALLDIRLPHLRRYIWSLFRSNQLKDQVIALMLSLLDQGRFRADDLAVLTPQFIQFRGDLVLLGNRIIHADPKILYALKLLASNPDPTAPLFAIPLVKEDGSYDLNKMRRIGAHLLTRVVEQLGISLEALQSYHATQTYSQEMQRVLYQGNVSVEQAHMLALMRVAEELGHDLKLEPNPEAALQIIQSAVIDPVAAAAIKKNAASFSLGKDSGIALAATVDVAVPYVSAELSDKTVAEQAFSKWLHTVPAHEYIVGEKSDESTP